MAVDCVCLYTMYTCFHMHAFKYVSVMIACQTEGFACFLIYMPLSKAQDGRIEKWERDQTVCEITQTQAGLKRAKGGGGDRRATERSRTS